jgi:hypothetical protein
LVNFMCAVDDMGKNSVRPSTTLMMMLCTVVMIKTVE